MRIIGWEGGVIDNCEGIGIHVKPEKTKYRMLGKIIS
jgi:hypothetical protein